MEIWCKDGCESKVSTYDSAIARKYAEQIPAGADVHIPPSHPSHLSSYLKVHPLAYARALKSMSSTVVSACQPPAWSMASRRQTPAVPLNPTKSVGVCGSALERRGTGPCSLTFKQALNPGSAD